MAVNERHKQALLLDFSAYAFALATGAFVLMEQTSDKRMAWRVSQFVARGIVRDSARASFLRAPEHGAAHRLAVGGSTDPRCRLPVGVALAAARCDADRGRHLVRPDGGRRGLADLGRLVRRGVSLPLFWFLLGGRIWRFVTWGLMLRDIARCDLRLVATHADRCGGIAFIGQYPRTYLIFVFALSSVVAAGVLKNVVYAGASLMSFKFALFGLVVFLCLAFVVPLLAFAPVLKRPKRQALSRYGALVSQHNLAFEENWIDGAPGAAGESPLGSPDVSSLADLSASCQLVSAMKAVPVTKASVVPLVGAALLPLAVVALTQAPLKQILAQLKGVLFI